MSLDLASRCGGTVHRLHAEQESIAPAHERLAVDVLIVFGEVESAAQRFIHHAAIVARGKTELRFHGRAQQRTPEFIQILPLHHDSVGWTLEGFRVVRRYPHIFQAQRLERLEAEHIPDNRRSQVGNRSLFEQIDIVGDVGNVLIRARHRIDSVALRLVAFVRSQPVRPNHGPRRRRRLSSHRRCSFNRIDARLRHQTERAQNVGGLRFIIGVVIAHFRIGRDACRPAALFLAGVVVPSHFRLPIKSVTLPPFCWCKS